ncbi:erythropoietin-like [Ambystoma mexicanum]|uniref:erythropoietin-like n=1 Tax=Ambystoma mexicanum TaxID=8296 RepID=UPI0037E95706
MELNRDIFLAAFLIIASLSMLNSHPLWCDRNLIHKYTNEFKDTEEKMASQGCSPAPLHNVSVMLSSVGMNRPEWQRKSRMTQKTEILSHLSMLSDAVRVPLNQTMPECIKQQLQNLSRVIRVIGDILKPVLIEEEGTPSAPLPTDRFKTETISSKIFNCYYLLMKGKIAMFLHGLPQTECSKGSRQQQKKPANTATTDSLAPGGSHGCRSPACDFTHR